MKWNKKIKEFFVFTASEQKGILVLLIIIAITLAIPYVYRILFPQPALSEAWKKELSTWQEDSLQTQKDTIKVLSTRKVFFSFNPNTSSDTQLRALGFSENAIKNLLHYRAKNGVITKKEDLKKIYGVTPGYYKLIEPYIIIPSFSEKFVRVKKPEEKITLLDLNSLDSLQLISFKGIGPSFAKRILKFRNSLGGYYSISQLSEVYGMNDTIIMVLKKHCVIDSALIKKIRINTLTAVELSKHPYISKYQSNGLMNYRKLQGSFKNARDFMASKIFPDSMARKILPYLDYN